ncbi:Leucyl/phenylalanyl-tRNA--protein transferase [Rubrivivax sp. A210]|uniref:leucyl/phenylalanyl-tRNA--protein transferase n=1 Tax=Rubrivivax sp. A210 TaxID=2772301 RepID=UPI00191B1A77|nr:leucyl/phenylalanyl-tRNA--protein transferase [Rubrivivax sp. A210]CAD5374876.1 Leucyl/phenylalanyl-tRNA--protein transferase [Rubrivivax sp. A210]
MLTWIDDGQPLPPPAEAEGADSEVPGLLAAGGRVTPRRLEEAYSQGIFPWYGPGQPVLWWSPDPRMVLAVADFRVSHSLRKSLRRFLRTPGCEVRFDSAFEQVMDACAGTPRPGQDGTWIVPEMVAAYCAWHRHGFVHSAETWINGELAGGLYFVCIGRMCYGESMFAHRTDASKIALAAFVAACRARGVALVDCQQNTRHLASFGAREISRTAFQQHLAAVVPATPALEWTYDESAWDLLGITADRGP